MKWFIDFEASGLHPTLSYPIEVAACDENGENGFSFLIKPSAEWTFWSWESEQIHRIKQSDLQFGLSSCDVANALNQSLQGKEVYCDGGYHDEFWCNRLFDAANLNRKFYLLNYYHLIQNQMSAEDYMDFTKIWSKKVTAHRALADTKQLAEFYQKYKNL